MSGDCVVTGLGVVAPSGIGVAEHWATVRANEVRVRPIEDWDTTTIGVSLAGQVRGFEPEAYVDARLLVQTDRWTWMGLAATAMALEDAAYDPAAREPYATGVVVAAGSGGNEFGQREMTNLYGTGPAAVTTYQSIAWFYAASAGQTSIRYGTRGPSSVVVSEGAGGLDSIGHAVRAIRRGTPAVIAGGTEAALSPYALACQSVGGLLTTATRPEQGYRPFDAGADGYAPGEGGAVLLVEDARSAAERGAHVHGRIAGYAATHDAWSVTGPAPDATQLRRAVTLALADAGLPPEAVDLVIADAAGEPRRDALEAAALRQVFGPYGVPVAAPSGLVGRLSAGGSALAVVTALLSIRDGVLPAVGNLHDPDPAHRLDLVRRPRPGGVDVVVVLARGMGGFNSCLVVRRHPSR